MTPSNSGEGVESGRGARAAAIEAFRREDPRLTPPEKETTLRFARDEDHVAVYTAERGVGRRLLAHPEASIDAVTVIAGERARAAIALDELDTEDPPPVVGVRGELPVGVLTVSRDRREDDAHAEVITRRVLEEVPR